MNANELKSINDKFMAELVAVNVKKQALLDLHGKAIDNNVLTFEMNKAFQNGIDKCNDIQDTVQRILRELNTLKGLTEKSE